MRPLSTSRPNKTHAISGGDQRGCSEGVSVAESRTNETVHDLDSAELIRSITTMDKVKQSMTLRFVAFAASYNPSGTESNVFSPSADGAT